MEKAIFDLTNEDNLEAFRKIIEHTAKNPECPIPHSGKISEKPFIYVAKGSGIYLMSGSDKSLYTEEEKNPYMQLVLYADEPAPGDDEECCDFAEKIELEHLEKALYNNIKKLEIIFNNDSLEVRTFHSTNHKFRPFTLKSN